MLELWLEHPNHCNNLALVTYNTKLSDRLLSVPPGTHLHLSEVMKVGVECFTKGHNIDTAMSQR